MIRRGGTTMFDDTLNVNAIDFRKRPELYRVGKGGQGVLQVDPYKSEILPHGRFKTDCVGAATVNDGDELGNMMTGKKRHSPLRAGFSASFFGRLRLFVRKRLMCSRDELE